MKRTIKYIVCALLILLGLGFGSTLLVVRSGRVQTWVIQQITGRLSDELQTDVHIDRVKIHFLNRLQLYDFYLSDQQGDTLLYVPQMEVRFRPKALRYDQLDFPLIRLHEPYIVIRQDTAWANYQFLAEAFSSSEPREPLRMPLRVKEVAVEEATVRLQYIPRDYDIRIRPIDIRLSAPWVTADSMDVRLQRLSMQLNMQQPDLKLETTLHGSTDSIVADRIVFTYRDKQILSGQVRVIHPLHKDCLQTQIDCHDLYGNRALLQDLLSELRQRPVQLPEPLMHLGDIHYKGQIVGRLSHLVLRGSLRTAIGAVYTDCVLNTDTSFSDLRVAGSVSTPRLRLHRLLPDVPIGDLAMQGDIRMHYRQNEPIDAYAQLNISGLTYQDYTYRDMHLTGTYRQNLIHFDLRSHDPNAQLRLQGQTDPLSTHPYIEASLGVEHLRLDELNLTSQVREQDLQLQARLNLSTHGEQATWLDHLNGQLTIDSVCYTNFGHQLASRNISVQVTNKKNENSLIVLSNGVRATVKGQYRWSTLPQTFHQYAYSLFPRLLHQRPYRHSPNEMEFYCYIQQADSLLQVLTESDIHLPEQQTIKGYIRERQKEQGLQIFIPTVATGKLETQDIALAAVQNDDKASLTLSMTEHPVLSDSARLNISDTEINLQLEAERDSAWLNCRFGTPNSTQPHANIQVLTRFDQYANRPFASATIQPSSFYFRDTLWTLQRAHVEYAAADTALTISGFDLRSSTQYVRANGTASTRMTDSIRVDMQNVNLSYIMRNFDLDRAITADGQITGAVTLFSLFSEPMLEAKVHMPKGYLNETLLGELNATASLDKENKQIRIDAIAQQDNRTIVDLHGKVIPAEKYWELDMQLDSADLHLVNHWTKRILKDVGGRGYGWLGVYGRRHNTWVRARLFGKDAHLTVPVTGVRYTFTDSVLIDTTYVAFPTIRVRDDEHHYGTLNGRVTHSLFKDFAYDLTMQVEDMMVLNLPYSAQQRVYGKVYASGDAHLYGDEQTGTHLDAEATTRGKSDFYFNTGVASEAADNSFIEFVSEEEEDEPASVITQPALPQTKSNPFVMNLNLAVTPAATVHLLFDSRSGNGISGQGEGDIRLRWETVPSDVKMYGSYRLQQGLFSYSVANIIHRDFQIADGSSVTWSGNPLTPVLDVTAKYKVTASLRDLFGSDASQLTTDRTSVPVECLIYMTDNLNDPVLRFGIDLPQSDESVASQVKSVINSDEMLMRQVIYLLVFNRFFTPEYLQTASTGANDTYSLLSSTVTGQINSWLSRLTDVVTIGFNFRTDGEGSTASQEYETQFQVHPINRLSINGNVGYRYNDLSNRPFFGDVDVEYQLTEDGKLRVKGFTHTVDKYSLKQANTVQGIGLLFRHDFNPGDAKRKRNSQAAGRKKTKNQKKTD